MGVFTTYNNVKRGNQRISERYLKKMGFSKCSNWGSPFHWGPGTVFWEKYIIQEKDGELQNYSATLWYFPETFTGYVTSFGNKAANKIVAMINGNTKADDYNGDALCKNDIQFAIDKMTHTLNKYNSLSIN
jgi:hypothetical protein